MTIAYQYVAVVGRGVPVRAQTDSLSLSPGVPPAMRLGQGAFGTAPGRRRARSSLPSRTRNPGRYTATRMPTGNEFEYAAAIYKH